MKKKTLVHKIILISFMATGSLEALSWWMGKPMMADGVFLNFAMISLVIYELTD